MHDVHQVHRHVCTRTVICGTHGTSHSKHYMSCTCGAFFLSPPPSTGHLHFCGGLRTEPLLVQLLYSAAVCGILPASVKGLGRASTPRANQYKQFSQGLKVEGPGYSLGVLDYLVFASWTDSSGLLASDSKLVCVRQLSLWGRGMKLRVLSLYLGLISDTLVAPDSSVAELFCRRVQDVFLAMLFPCQWRDPRSS